MTVTSRAGRSLLASKASQFGPSNLRTAPSFQILSRNSPQRRDYASEAPDYDVIFIGGGVAGYVGAIKAGQEGLKVCLKLARSTCETLTELSRLPVSKNEDH